MSNDRSTNQLVPVQPLVQPNQRLQAEDYVKGVCDRRAVIRYNRTVQLDDQPSSMKLLEGRLILDSHAWQLKFPDTVVKLALQQYIQENDKHIVQRYADLVAFSPIQTDEPLRAWVRAVTGTDNELDIVVMKHFIWQVKRKMRNLPVEYELMPVVCGQTGSGKSRAVERLLEPLRELAEVGRDFSIFTDTREHFIFHRMFVVALDEMARADSTDVNAIKQVISAKDISYRGLYTQESVVGRMVSTFIGTSNNFLNEVILDPTSARRFWQLLSAPKADWTVVNSLDYLAIWRCVDEQQAASPIRPHWAAIQEKQHTEFRYKGAVEEWFEDRWVIDDGHETKASEAFEDFKDWAAAANHGQKITLKTFCNTLMRMQGMQKVRKAAGAYYSIRRVQAAPDATAGKTYNPVIPFARPPVKE
jgi:hypothetical protein